MVGMLGTHRHPQGRALPARGPAGPSPRAGGQGRPPPDGALLRDAGTRRCALPARRPLDDRQPHAARRRHLPGRRQAADRRARRRLLLLDEVRAEAAAPRRVLPARSPRPLGQLLKGSNLYRLRVPRDVPARDHWSILAYAKESKAFLPNDLDRIGVTSRDRRHLRTDADGSVDVYFGPEAPHGRACQLGAHRRRLLPDPLALRTREGRARPLVQDARSRESVAMEHRFEVKATPRATSPGSARA